MKDQRAVCAILMKTNDSKSIDLSGCGVEEGLNRKTVEGMDNHAMSPQTCETKKKKEMNFIDEYER